MTATPSLKTARTTLRRHPERGDHDFDTIAAILDEGLYCHVGFAQEGRPFVVPTGYGRDGTRIYIHGSSASRMLRSLADGVDVCLTVTLIDGLVLARSAFHHSTNYRSVMVVGRARLVDDDEKLHGLRTVVEHLVPGRWADVRPPAPQELKATAVLRMDIGEASAKVRAHGAIDDEEDYGLPIWAGVVPLELVPGPPIPDPRLQSGLKAPEYAVSYRRPSRKF
jgi:nitroimidazol reductase NimA-like FMN-containing flavoprotein (pyridoxamine 5'-phosphate oxidase superfamily)